MTPQKIILISTDNPIFSQIITSIEHALGQIGINTRTLNLDRPQDQLIANLKEILEYAPDLAIFIGLTGIIQLRDMAPDQHFWEQYKIPYVQLFYDFPMNFPAFSRWQHRYLQAIFTSDRSHIPLFNRYGFPEVYHLPLASTPHPRTIPVEREPTMAVSFVGSLADETTCARYYQELPTTLQEQAQSLVEQKITNMDYRIFSEENILPLQDSDFFYPFFWYVDSRYSNYIRKHFISSLSKHLEVHVFGNDAWRPLANRVRLHAGVTPQKLPDIYRQTQINLNLTPAQLNTGVTQRIFDCYGAEGFLISDQRENLQELFQGCPDQIPTFRTPQELIDSCAYYLAHEAELYEKKLALSQWVIKYHSWTKRVKHLLTTVGNIRRPSATPI